MQQTTYSSVEYRRTSTHCSGVSDLGPGTARRGLFIEHSDTVKRSKPHGVELVFNPTVRNNHRARMFDIPSNVTVPNGLSCWLSENGPPVSKSRTDFISTYDGFGFSFPTQSTSWPRPSNLALLHRIKDEKVNLAMMLAEYRESAKLFSMLVSGVVDLYRKVRRGQLLHLLFRGGKNAPQLWLMYRYGVSPLLSDAKAIVDLMAHSSVKPLVRRYSVSHQITEFAEDRVVYPNSVNHKVSRLRSDRINVRDVAWVEYDSLALANLSGLGLTNLPQLAWEVIPFSFVVDWVLSIGDSLAALDALSGVRRAIAQRSVKQRHTLLWPHSGSYGEKDYFERDGLSLDVGLPQWEPSFTWKRLVDSVALGRSALRSVIATR